MVHLENREYVEVLIHGGDIYSAKEKLKELDHPPEILDFSANINPLGLPDGVKQAIINSIDCYNAYPDPLCRELISDLAKFEEVPESWILCGNGAADLIYRFVIAENPKKAMVLAPTFAEYEEALNVVSCQIFRYELFKENDFQVDLGILDALDKDMDMLFLCNPNNPTGQLIPKKMILKVLEKCKELGILLIMDECFNDFLEEPDRYSAKDYLKEYDNLIILKAFTKIYAMAGLRLGYCIMNHKARLKQMQLAGQPWSVSIPAQIAGIQAMKEKEYLIHTKEMIREERKYLIQSLLELGITVISSSANYIFIKYTFPTSKTLHELLFEKGILIRNCDNYHGLGSGYYRLCIKKHEENKALIDALSEIKSCE